MNTPNCAFHHHTVALTTGYMTMPCAPGVQDKQLCCAHNERGRPSLIAALDLLLERGVTTPEQDQKLRTAMHHTQQRVFSCDLSTNFMVYLYLMQENSGPVCAADRHDAKSHEKRLRGLLGMSPNAKFDKAAIEAYAERSHAEASLPIRLISALVAELEPAIEKRSAIPGARRKITALLNGLSEELFSPLAHPDESPWFQRARPE